MKTHMHKPIELQNTTTVTKSINRSSLRLGFLLIPLTLACFALSPAARAVDPPPDGGYDRFNTAEGTDALFSLTTLGFFNTATGFEALFSNTTGSANTANGYQALFNNTGGNNDTANGLEALFSNTTGSFNTASGLEARFINTTGSFNTASGHGSLFSNTTGLNNAADGFQALFSNTIGNFDTASGQGSLFSNTTGRNNTGDGQNAHRSNTTGSSNIALGSNAGFNLTVGSNNIDIFDRGVAGEANTIRIGKQGTQRTTFIAGISGATVTGTAVVVDSNGQLGVAPSSQRFKDAIQPMNKASEAILALKPVTFRYKHELDPKGIPQFGLVAEQVEKVNPDLVARDADGKAYTVRYEAVNAMLLNEFLKEHRTVQDLEATVAQQQMDFQKQIQALTTRLNAQESQLRRVSEQVQESKLARQLVADSQ